MKQDPPSTPPHPRDLDAWLDATDVLAPGNRNARTLPDDANVVHLTGPAGDLVMREWPGTVSSRRLEQIAGVLDGAHASAGEVVPVVRRVDGRPFTEVKGARFTARTWLPGHPLGRYGELHTADGRAVRLPLPESHAAHALIAETAGILAQVHASSERLAGDPGMPTHTIATLMNGARGRWFERRKTLGEHAARERDIRRWLRCGNRVIPTASDLLRNEESLLVERSVVIHGDVWPVNILVTGHEDQRHVTGVLGWSNLAAGSPVIDLAALCVHMQGWSAALTESVVESYMAHRRLLPNQRRIIPAVAALDLVDQVGDLLDLTYVDESMARHPGYALLRGGMKVMLNSLETLTSILAPDIEQTERFQRFADKAAGLPVERKRSAPRSPQRGRQRTQQPVQNRDRNRSQGQDRER